MRVVGGKTGTDGKLFAHIVWTVPSGPAEKGGLQQGDKVNFICSQVLFFFSMKALSELFSNFLMVKIQLSTEIL